MCLLREKVKVFSCIEGVLCELQNVYVILLGGVRS